MSISNCKVLKLPTLPKSIPNRIQQKSGRLPQRFPPPSQVLRRQPIPKEKKKKKQPNHTQPESGICTYFSAAAASSDFWEYRDVLPAFPAGGGAGKRSSHELGSLNAGWGWNSSLHDPKLRSARSGPGVPGERFGVGDAAEGGEESLSPFLCWCQKNPKLKKRKSQKKKKKI